MVRACRLVDDTPHALPRLWELYRIIVTVRQQSANVSPRKLMFASQLRLRATTPMPLPLASRETL